MDESGFFRLMHTISEGWNTGDAAKAAACFAEDAVYVEPPDQQVYYGRAALYEFFGGAAKPEPPMQMTWHGLAFNQTTQIGFGEYTFQMNRRYHGIVTVQVAHDLIARWREYQYSSELEFDAFVGDSRFNLE